jgi:integrase/recombinase XerD
MKTNLHQFKHYLKRKGYRPSTVEGVLRDAAWYYQWVKEKTKKRPKSINYKDALKYVEYLKNTDILPRTINLRIAAARHYCNHLNMKKNPFQGMRVKGEKKRVLTDILTTNELLELYESYQPITAIQYRNKIILGLYAFQGIATGEVDNIEATDIDVRKGTIRLKGTERVNKRILKMEVAQLLDMVEYLNEIRPVLKKQFNDRSGLLFVLTGESPTNVHNGMKKLSKYLRNTNTKFNSFAQLRRSVIVNWLKEDNIRLVQYKAGHRYVSSTERYQTNNLQQLKEAILRSHPMG